jgi:hypothetical protein
MSELPYANKDDFEAYVKEQEEKSKLDPFIGTPYAMEYVDKQPECCGICLSFQRRIRRSIDSNEFFSYCDEHERVAVSLPMLRDKAEKEKREWDITEALDFLIK